MTNPEGTPEGQEGTVEGVGEQEGTDTPSETPKPSEAAVEPDVFQRDYVEQLRAEAAANRVKAKRADDLAARLVLAIAEGTGKLIDASDLAVSAEVLPEFMDDDGMPDEAKVQEAVARLIAARPHLARPVFAGDVGQGVTGITEAGPGLGAMLRQAAL